ncbi:hypothetical protein CRUP_013954 [Coryphaenoides rupestris]|nr:hypothetical protein CRUP_013954 [Coryphaenoides rupestris]
MKSEAQGGAAVLQLLVDQLLLLVRLLVTTPQVHQLLLGLLGVEVAGVQEVLVLQGAQPLRQHLLPLLHRVEGGGEDLAFTLGLQSGSLSLQGVTLPWSAEEHNSVALLTLQPLGLLPQQCMLGEGVLQRVHVQLVARRDAAPRLQLAADRPQLRLQDVRLPGPARHPASSRETRRTRTYRGTAPGLLGLQQLPVEVVDHLLRVLTVQTAAM